MLVSLLLLILAPAAQDTGELMAAAERGDAESVARALALGAPVDARDGDGRTALMVAATKGHLDVVRVLVHAGADVNVRTDDGLSAIGFAIGIDDVTDYLRDNGAEESWDDEPELENKPELPTYPPEAREHKITGDVVLKIKVRRDGTTEVMEVITPLPYCTEAAREHALRWRWKAAEKDGQAVAAIGTITVHFDLYSRHKRSRD
jgi:TonB family protein